MIGAAAADAIDCDVHIAVPGFETLSHYLDEYWHSYIDDATVRLVLPAYPPGVPTTGPAPAGSHDELMSAIDSARPGRAILGCLTLDGVHRSPYYASAIATAVNSWVRDEFLARDERLRAGIVVSTLDIPAAVTEIERWAEDPRFVQILLPVRSDIPYGNRLYRPLLAAAAKYHLPIAIHAWGRGGAAPTMTGITTTYIEDYLSNAHIAQAQMMSLVAEGVFSDLPDLKVLFAECGFSWLPSQLWRFDKDWKGVWREVPWVSERPSEYVRRHIRFTTEPAHLPQDPQDVTNVIEMVGPEVLMYASDHPHTHHDGGNRLFAALSSSEVEAVLRRNALAFYGEQRL